MADLIALAAVVAAALFLAWIGQWEIGLAFLAFFLISALTAR